MLEWGPRCLNVRNCKNPGRVVVDRNPGWKEGSYVTFCWPCYWSWTRAHNIPAIVNYLDHLQDVGDLRWDGIRQKPVVE